MAAGGDAATPRWPMPIAVDDDAKRGFVFITLSMDELAVSSSVFSGTKIVNGGEVTPEFKQEEVTVTARVTDRSGAHVHYRYKKKLPENIDPVASKMNVLKDKEKSTADPKFNRGRVRLELKKDPDVSWVPHMKYLIKPETE